MSKYYKVEDVEWVLEKLAREPNYKHADEEWFEGVVLAQDRIEELPTIEVSEENELKFYYVESIDDYWIGQRLDNFYYAEWNDRLGFVWTHSRYLPWGEHVVAPDTLWKEHTYPSEPREIPFTEWIVGFMKKHSVVPNAEVSEDAISREYMLRNLNGYGKDWQEDCEIAEIIRNAPNVVPTTEQSSTDEREGKDKRIMDMNEVRNELQKSYGTGYNDGYSKGYEDGYEDGCADRKEGEWIPDPDGGFKCSNCRAEEDEFIYGTGMRYVNGESEFCPNCGAKMKRIRR